jgi:hypothetical protein
MWGEAGKVRSAESGDDDLDNIGRATEEGVTLSVRGGLDARDDVKRNGLTVSISAESEMVEAERFDRGNFFPSKNTSSTRISQAMG